MLYFCEIWTKYILEGCSTDFISIRMKFGILKLFGFVAFFLFVALHRSRVNKTKDLDATLLPNLIFKDHVGDSVDFNSETFLEV